MTVLADREIQKMLNDGDLDIEPFEAKNLTPNGYDLSISEVFIKSQDIHINDGLATIPPHTWFAISTKEFIKIWLHCI